ncbi:MAG: glycosyltransferase family 2 protein [Bacteroidia bacterium]|nr:glycosyltransferase family 2 protein [Bacteroidia bacterium]MDW8088355.1 glycosyltransferase family 2 protein [Bacteroidia bacterium]
MAPVYAAILAHGGKKWLEQFLPTVLATDYPNLTVWVIDNASKPPLYAWLRDTFPTVKALRYEENLGYAGGYQRFFEEHGHDVPYLALLNSDVEVPPTWLSPLIRRLEKCPQVAAVQPRIRAWQARTEFEYAGAAGGFLDPWGYPTCRGRGEKDENQYAEPSRIFWASGAAFVLRTQAVLDSLQGLLFKPYYFMHMEEIDLCWRLQRAGWQIAYEPASIVYHVGGGSLTYTDTQKTYYNFRNSLFLLWENLSGLERYRRVGWRLLLDAPAAFYFLLRYGPAHVGAIARAHWTFFRYVAARRLNSPKCLPYKPLRQLNGVLSRPLLWGAAKPPHLPLSC